MVLKNTSLSILKVTVAGLGLLLSHVAVAGCVQDLPNSWVCVGDDSTGLATGNTPDIVEVVSGAIVNGNITTDGGDDVVTNHGTVTGYLRLGAGADSLQNFGEVGVEIRGGPDGDEIVNGGIAPFIRGRAGDDVVTLITGAKSTVINGGDGIDTLVFKFAWLSPLDFQAIEAAVASNLAAGSVSVAGQTYTWRNMEQLTNNSTLRAAQVPTLSDLALILLGLTLAMFAYFRRPSRMSV